MTTTKAIPLPAGPTPTPAQPIAPDAAISEDELRNLLKQNAELAERIAEMQISAAAKDTRLLPLNARRVLVWMGIVFGIIAAMAFLGWLIGPQQ